MIQTVQISPSAAPPVVMRDTTLPRNGTEAAALRHALLLSRQRWRQFGAIAADIAFETDTQGRFTFVAPDVVMGWPAALLLGQPAQALLLEQSGPDPFRFTAAVHRRHTWMRTGGGASVCMALSIVPMLDEAGRSRGVRGVAVDVTEHERAAAATAAALRRGEVLDHILAEMRQEVLAPRMMRAVLDSLMRALGCRGAAVLDLLHGGTPLTLHEVGAAPPVLDPIVQAELVPALAETAETRTIDLPDGAQLLACPCSTRFGERAAMFAWRSPGARAWDAEDLVLAASVTGVIRIVLEHEAIQRELARQARTDPLTGLLNRRAFMEEAGRRLDRLGRASLPGTLMFIDLDRFKYVNDRFGHEAGDSALLLTSALLHRTFRPTDLIARLGGDEFAIWLDGADSLTAAERAEDLRIATPLELAHLTAGEAEGIGMSIGIAMRLPDSDEPLEQLIHRADEAMYEVKRAGRGHWRVSQPKQAG